MFDIMRITLFCLKKRLSKHKMTICSKNFLGGMAPMAPLVAPMERKRPTPVRTRFKPDPRCSWRRAIPGGWVPVTSVLLPRTEAIACFLFAFSRRSVY